MFNREITQAVHTWVGSTAYNHCFLVIPIVLFLLWERRFDLAVIPAEPAPAYIALGIPVAVVWLAAERLGVMEGRQLAALSFVQVLFLAVLGRRLWWAACGPLLYLYFLVPFGDFLTPRLQDVTTWFIQRGVDILGIPAYIDGYTIEIPQGAFFVAEACAGLRFLIASIAFGCLYALMMYRSPVRRGVFVLASMIVPIIANGLRGLGIVALGYVLGSAQAAAADHVIYGWVFFSFVILLLIALGLPFRQDEVPVRSGAVPAGQLAALRPAFVSVVLVGLVAALGPLLTVGLAAAASPAAAAVPRIDVGDGCTVTVGVPAGAVATQRVVCGEATMDLAWEAFSPRVTAAPLMAEWWRLSRRADTENLSESWLPSDRVGPRAWRIMQSDDPAFVLAAAVWVDGKIVRQGMAMRARMALNSLLGSAHVPLLVTVTPVASAAGMSVEAQKAAAASLALFLHVHADLDARVGALTAVR